MLHKTFNLIETKAEGDDGTFEALVSVFGNVDSVGDRVQPGAFAKTLESWREKGDPIPVILSHQWDDPMAHIGVVYPGDAKETERGLAVKGHLDVNDNDVAKQVHRLMKRRSLKEFSFGYRVIKEKRAKDGANDLHEIELVEVGPTLKGANPDTELHAVKSALEAEQQEPPSEAELHKRVQELQFTEVMKDVPKGTPPATDPVEQLAGELKTLKSEVGGDLEGIKAALEANQERERVASEAELRKRDQERRLAEETKDVPEGTGPAPDPVDQLAGRFEELKTEVGKDLEGLTAALAVKQAQELALTEAELRKKEQELRLAEATKDVPDSTPPAPDSVEQLHAKVDNLSTEFETFKTELAKSLEGIKAAVEEPQGANTAKHDPLRQRSNQAVLEIESDGISLRKSPTIRQEPAVEAAPEAELKARSRREMLTLLTGVSNDQE